MNRRQQAEPYLFLDQGDPLLSRMIDRRDSSIWPSRDTGFRVSGSRIQELRKEKEETEMTNSDLTKLITKTIRALPSFDDNGTEIVRFDCVVDLFTDALAEVIPDLDQKSFEEECYKAAEKVA